MPRTEHSTGLRRAPLALAAAALVAAAGLTSGCASETAAPARTTVAAPASAAPAEPAAPGDAERFWQTFRVSGDEVEPYAPMRSMARSADATVVGRFAGISGVRTLTAEGNDVVHYVTVDLAISRALAGKRLPDTVPLELMVIPAAGQSIDEVRAELAASLPQEEMVLFLRAKRGQNEAGRYRVVNSRGLWADTTRGGVDAPLAEEPVAAETPYAADAAKARSVRQLADLVDTMG